MVNITTEEMRRLKNSQRQRSVEQKIAILSQKLVHHLFCSHIPSYQKWMYPQFAAYQALMAHKWRLMDLDNHQRFGHTKPYLGD